MKIIYVLSSFHFVHNSDVLKIFNFFAIYGSRPYTESSTVIKQLDVYRPMPITDYINGYYVCTVEEFLN